MKEIRTSENSENANENAGFLTFQAQYKTKENAMQTKRTRQEIANQYAGEYCTLDGLPASILGRKLPFAIIRQYGGGQATADYAWETVANCMEENGGKFRT